jgi:hypothetical protein
MSTKIYNGYKLDRECDVGELFSIYNDLKRILNVKYKKVFTKDFSRELTYLHDRIKSNLTTESFSVMQMWEGKNKEIASKLKTGMDYNCSVMFYFHSGIRRVFIQVFPENKEYETSLSKYFKTKGLDSYDFWDNVDPLEGVSDENWKIRGEEWDNILGKTGIPSESGLYFDLLSDRHIFPDYEDLNKGQPSIDDRVNHLVQMNMMNAFKKTQHWDEKDIWGTMKKFADHMKENEKTQKSLTAYYLKNMVKLNYTRSFFETMEKENDAKNIRF